MTEPRIQDLPSPFAAILSAFFPGLGQITKGRWGQGVAILGLLGALIAMGWSIGQHQDRAAEILFLLLTVFPIWIIQSYDAYLPEIPSHGRFSHTLKLWWTQGHDIRYLGALFLLSALLDIYIIMANPSYALPFFCSKPTGLLGLLAKIQSPFFHVGIGYGFLRLQKWGLVLFLGYAGLGLTNAFVNYGCFGFGRIRTVLVITLILFTLYLWVRRQAFRP